MKLWAKISLGVVGLIAVGAGSAAAYVAVTWDKNWNEVEGPDLKASTDSAVIARGEYLVRGPAHCSSCHVGGSDESARVDAGEKLPMRGGLVMFDGPLGKLVSANLTPDSTTGIGRYTDRQLFRMLRHNVKPNGMTSLAPIMPFHGMADEDLVAVVSYLRSQPRVRNEVPAAVYTTFGKAIRTIAPAFRPQFVTHASAAPAAEPTTTRGEYLARFVANCVGCHTNRDMRTGDPIGPEFAGGLTFQVEPGAPGEKDGLAFRSANLTPDTTGVLVKIGSKDGWIRRFRTGRVHKGSPMPWGQFALMSDADLEALWLYFNSLQPVSNSVQTVYRDTTRAN